MNYKEAYKVLERDYKEVNETKNELNNKISNRNVIIGLLIATIISSILILPNLSRNIDEGKFCLQKLNTHFPEYNFYKANYRTDNDNNIICIGTYQLNSTTRDGLEEVKEEKIKEFRLIDEADEDYIKSDDWANNWIFLGVVILLCSLAFLFMMDWKE